MGIVETAADKQSWKYEDRLLFTNLKSQACCQRSGRWTDGTEMLNIGYIISSDQEKQGILVYPLNTNPYHTSLLKTNH